MSADAPVRTDVGPAELSTQPEPVGPGGGSGPLALARTGWRRLTSMRTALVLLFLLALASIPGSLLPQRPLNPIKVDRYLAEHPGVGRLLDRAGFFDVFATPWFAAIYLLLFVSVVGCVVPRLRMHARALRTPPAVVPRRLDRLPESSSYEADGSPTDLAETARRTLRGWRTVTREEPDGVVTIAAERGYLRETGNLLFHGALVALLVGIAAGRLWGYQGTELLVEGGPGVCNAVPLYDSFRPGKLVDGSSLEPFCVDRLDSFTATYDPDGTPSKFEADIAYTLGDDGPGRRYALRVNEPLRVGGVRVYLVSHGFAPRFTVRTPDGRRVDASAPFLPEDGTLLSEGAVKLLDEVRPQLALYGLFAPLAVDPGDGTIRSASPQPGAPGVAIVVYRGDLGLDSGTAQSVYSIDQRQVQRGALKAVGTAKLATGGSTKLDDGTVITFDGYHEWATLQVNRDPGQLTALVSAAAVVLGLLLSLAVRRRRVFLRIAPATGEPGGRSVVAVGGLARTDAGGFGSEFARVVERLRDPPTPRED
ncbi:MAG TPA: cytochrome c biogenesis protein ResB [Mycobacteriales bacterium]|nr:cytochrome c biogenesis protein ResB [Mycobacteriales bacterium]